MSLLLTRRRWLSNQPPTRVDRPPYTLRYAIPVRRRAVPAPAVAAGCRRPVGLNRVLLTGGGCAIYQGIGGITDFLDVAMALDWLAA